MSLLEIKDLHIDLKTRSGELNLVQDINIEIKKGETFGIVGESGCGKSLTANSIMGLLPNPPLKVKQGEILFKGKNLLEISEKEKRSIRGNEISMIFQEPMTALDPLFTIGEQMKEAILIHDKSIAKNELNKRVVKALKSVGIPRPEKIINEFPHQLSGGMLQRVMIGIAMINNPELLIADEPTTALDVTIQAQILSLMNDLKDNFGSSIIMITHDLGVIAQTCERVAVFYAGQVVEVSETVELFKKANHPYTKGLIESVKSLGYKADKLYTISGMVPTADNFSKGCRFCDRCEQVMEKCHKEIPALKAIGKNHYSRCWLNGEV